MKRIIKIGIFGIILLFIGIISAAILFLPIKPLAIENMNNTYQGVIITTTTQKDTYDAGEMIPISAELKNTNQNITFFNLIGQRYIDTKELYSKLHVTIYDENYTRIWHYDIPGKYERTQPATYNISIPALSTIYFTDFISWNQTAKDITASINGTILYQPNKQVPPGVYIIIVKVPITASPNFIFGSSKRIEIQ
jgi:hypothetical protein